VPFYVQNRLLAKLVPFHDEIVERESVAADGLLGRRPRSMARPRACTEIGRAFRDLRVRRALLARAALYFRSGAPPPSPVGRAWV
ncbi:MAG TPA: hypothetical protein VFY49_17625, partial [Myxococcota bacterium]|nr:hypothetical protein [Myxococcota bacterium]